jgi:multiple sugar transport system ATP-binding protein
MANIELTQVAKRFGESYAVQPLDLQIKDGEFIALLGPSGCGKTTTLRMIAGLETVSEGKINLNGTDVTQLPPSQRDIAMVFQFFALYPHLSVRENIAFPLKAQGGRGATVDQQVNEVARMIQIEHMLRLKPGALSSGDQQRVALARALVRRPACFLMDEPLGALDADFRETMRSDIKKLMLAQNATTVYVTHDQIEAMAMADRIVVMSKGVVEQVGTPAEVYHDPKSLFVARFIGSPGMNLLSGVVQEGAAQLPGSNRYALPQPVQRAIKANKVIVGFRPEAIAINPTGALTGNVLSVDLHGSYTMLIITLGSEENVIHARVSRDGDYRVGETLRFDLKPGMVRFFDAETERAINY